MQRASTKHTLCQKSQAKKFGNTDLVFNNGNLEFYRVIIVFCLCVFHVES